METIKVICKNEANSVFYKKFIQKFINITKEAYMTADKERR